MKQELVFGSNAIKYWFDDFKREPKDIDIIKYNSNMNRDSYYYKNINNTEYFYNNAFKYILENNKNEYYVDPDFLYTIKISHSFWDINWDKTIFDIMFLKDKNCKFNKELFNLLYKDWVVIHGSKKVKMDVDCSEFFTNTITRKYEHDYLHEVFKFNDKPYHELIRKDLSKAYCSEELFNKLSHKEKIQCCMEEIFVLAFERHYLKGVPYKTSIQFSIKDIVTHITKGWFPLFIVDNIKEIFEYDKNHYIEKIKILKEWR